MVEVTGRALAERLATALDDAAGAGDLRVVDRATRLDPAPDGAFAYALGGDECRFADVFVAPTRVRVEFTATPAVAARAGADADLRVRPKAVKPPRTLVFVESVEEIRPALDVVEAVRAAVD